MSTANEGDGKIVPNEATSDLPALDPLPSATAGGSGGGGVVEGAGQVHHSKEVVPDSLESDGDTANAIAEARARLQALLSVDEVVLSEELAELLTLRELTWSRIPPLMRKLTLPFLTLKETLTLDTAVSEKGEEDERDHLVKAYAGLRSPGFDEWVFRGTNTGGFAGVRWARKRGIDLQNLKLEYEGLRGDKALGRLMSDGNDDMATFYALRCEMRDFKDNSYGHTPLYWASSNGHLEIVRILMDAGADVNNANDNGKTPLSGAASNGHLEIVQVLLDAGADVDMDSFGITPLYSASWNGHLEVVQALLDAKADVNKADCNNITPLYWASSEGHLEIVQVLLNAGAEVNKAFHGSNTTPLDEAVNNGHDEVADLLRGVGGGEGEGVDDVGDNFWTMLPALVDAVYSNKS